MTDSKSAVGWYADQLARHLADQKIVDHQRKAALRDSIVMESRTRATDRVKKGRQKFHGRDATTTAIWVAHNIRDPLDYREVY